MIILDTMVLSEPLKPKPNLSVVRWFNRQLPTDLFATSISQAEMEYGLWALPEGKRRRKLHSSITELFEVDFADRILSFDSKAALMYGINIAPVRQQYGKDAVKDLDGMIAAIAISHDRCKVATRDRRSYELMGLEVLDPWAASTEGSE